MTGRDGDGRMVCRQRVDHRDRRILREDVALWPRGTPVVLEGTCGWGWWCDELAAAGLKPHWACSRKVAGWRDGARDAEEEVLPQNLWVAQTPMEARYLWPVIDPRCAFAAELLEA